MRSNRMSESVSMTLPAWREKNRLFSTCPASTLCDMHPVTPAGMEFLRSCSDDYLRAAALPPSYRNSLLTSWAEEPAEDEDERELTEQLR